MWLFVIWGIVIGFLFWYKGIRPMSYWKRKGVKQAKPKWVIGDGGTITRTESMAEFVIRFYNLYPGARYLGFYRFTEPNLFINDLDLIKQVTVKDFDHFVDHRSFLPEDADPYWAKNLFALKGQRWKDMRPILSPSFTSSKMRSMFILMSECADTFMTHFLDKNQNVVEGKMKDFFTRFANDVIASAAFGVTIDSLAKPNNEFYLMGKKATDLTSTWQIFKFCMFMLAPKMCKTFSISLFDKDVTKFFQTLVDDTIKTREEKGIVRPDMIHLLMEARKGNNKYEETGLIDTGFATVEETDIGKVDTGSKSTQITNVDIAAQALLFFFAGFDAITNLMCFMAYELAVNPDIQDRLREEILDTKEKCGGTLNYEELMKMKYMDMVMSESLRKWPNNPMIDRICTKSLVIEPEKPDETRLYLEKGSIIWIPIIAIHRNPDYYPNPDKFDPERFSDENKHNIKPYTYLPFGLGPRNCIGSRFALLEAKILFFHLLDNFEIIPTKDTKIPLVLNKKSFALSADDGFHLGLKRISKSTT